ncbi:MAG: PglZ domain-containing protein [Bacteroidales bacterium]|nr:PglZ domain-containing protein [Bacteroidales bacterium]
MQILIRKIAERIAADYTRLSIVSNPDGLLTNPVVQLHLLSECGLNVIVGSQLQLRIHYELTYKASKDERFVYVCPSTETLLPDMEQEAYITDFSIGQLFPLFADKNLLQQLSFEELVILSNKMGTCRINMAEGRRMVEDIRKEEGEKHKTSAEYYRQQFQSLKLDWNLMSETVTTISDIIADAALAGVYDQLTEEWTHINESFQNWLDSNYVALQNSNPMLRPACVNSVLPHLANKYGSNDKVALVVVDGLAFWQWRILARCLQKGHFAINEDYTTAWLPTITMLSRQAIFRGDRPQVDYKQSPEAERRLWGDFWHNVGISSYGLQYLYDNEEFAINEGVCRLAYVTVEMDHKMHASRDMRDLAVLTDVWAPRFCEQLKVLKDMGFTIYLTSDHGSTSAIGQRPLTQVEKVFLYKDGSRGKRHLIYNSDHVDEQRKLYVSASEYMKLLSRDNWLAIRDFGAFERSRVSLITHGGSSFTEVVVPFVQL